MKYFALAAIVASASALQIRDGPMAVGFNPPQPTVPSQNVSIIVPDQPFSHTEAPLEAIPQNRHLIGTLELLDAKQKIRQLLTQAMNAEDTANYDKMQEIRKEIEELKAHLDILNVAHDSHKEYINNS